MKIVQFLASKGSGGLENVFVDLCNALAKTEALEVIVFKDAACIKKLDIHIQIHELPKKSSRYNIFLYIKLYKLMKKISPDIVHTHAAKATQIFYHVNKFLALPFVATKHNVRKGEIFNKVPHVIAVSNFVKESIENKNTKVIYNGIVPMKIETHYQNKIFTIVSVGRLDKVKGFATLIKACATLDFPFHLQIVGEGEDRENLEALISELKLEKRVTLLGYKSNVHEYLYASHLQVISSDAEGFSLAMAEGIFYAPILLSTKVGVCVEILPDMLLYNIEDLTGKITDVYRNKERYKEYFKYSKKNKEKLTIQVCVKEHISMYQEVTKDKMW
ncbi:MAG: glycosyltransferase [Sulfurovum sp.]|nr:glycosyltransferase [Sulfurovum sp.]